MNNYSGFCAWRSRSVYSDSIAPYHQAPDEWYLRRFCLIFPAEASPLPPAPVMIGKSGPPRLPFSSFLPFQRAAQPAMPVLPFPSCRLHTFVWDASRAEKKISPPHRSLGETLTSLKTLCKVGLRASYYRAFAISREALGKKHHADIEMEMGRLGNNDKVSFCSKQEEICRIILIIHGFVSILIRCWVNQVFHGAYASRWFVMIKLERFHDASRFLGGKAERVPKDM